MQASCGYRHNKGMVRTLSMQNSTVVLVSGIESARDQLSFLHGELGQRIVRNAQLVPPVTSKIIFRVPL
jgi:hypothetical protein